MLYSYVVDHDDGHAPNPYFGVCTLCRCKFRERKFRRGRRLPKNIVELAKKGDWIVGTGGADRRKSAGRGNLVYAMRVDDKLSRERYYADPRFIRKRPLKSGTSAQTLGDNLRPKSDFEKHEQFALISQHFYYFGANAVRVADRFPDLEKKGRGFKKRFPATFVDSFVAWLEKNHRPGKHGEPCRRKPQGSGTCKSCC